MKVDDTRRSRIVNKMQTVEMGREWLSYDEARIYSGIGKTTLWKLVTSGEIEAIKIGRSVKISKRALEAYLQSKRYSEVVAS